MKDKVRDVYQKIYSTQDNNDRIKSQDRIPIRHLFGILFLGVLTNTAISVLIYGEHGRLAFPHYMTANIVIILVSVVLFVVYHYVRKHRHFKAVAICVFTVLFIGVPVGVYTAQPQGFKDCVAIDSSEVIWRNNECVYGFSGELVDKFELVGSFKHLERNTDGRMVEADVYNIKDYNNQEQVIISYKGKIILTSMEDKNIIGGEVITSMSSDYPYPKSLEVAHSHQLFSLLHRSWVPSFGICYHGRLYKPDQEVTEAGLLPHRMEYVTSCSKLENYTNMEDH